jgi:NAD+ kinase
MKSIINDIGVVLKPSTIEELSNTLTNLTRWLKRRKKNIIFLESEKLRLESILSPKILEKVTFLEETAFFDKINLIISLGGDGTLIGLSSRIPNEIPIMGVNLGRLGFITEFSKIDFYEALHSILLGKYQTKEKSLYTVNINEYGKNEQSFHFINDIVFTKNSISRIFSLGLDIDNEHVYDISGDGLIISTPIGSTAYSLAAGGPIIHPDVKALLLTPICPHSLTHRPVVISENAHISVNLLDQDTEVILTIDGQKAVAIGHTDNVKISKAGFKKIYFVKNPERTYFQTLKDKFVHGRQLI